MSSTARLAATLSRVLAIVALLAGLGFAGYSVKARAEGITREQGEAILSELREIRKLLGEQQRAKAQDGDGGQPAKVHVEDSDLQALGSPTAPVTLVEYTDYQCPFCKRFHDRSWPELKKKYVDTGKLRYLVRDMPLAFHAQAMPSAIAARCAGAQGKFWPVHEELFIAQEALSDAAIRKTVVGLGVGVEAFDACVKNPATRITIEADIAEAERIGVTGTPGFVLGERKNGRLEGQLILGAQPTSVFSARIDALLGGAPPRAP